jgi:hypothetical protein
MTLAVELRDIDDGSDVPVINYCKRILKEGTEETRLDVCRDGRVDIIVNDVEIASQLRVSDSRFKWAGGQAGASLVR